jgi:hypothetical protein
VLLGDGWALVDTCGATDVDCWGPVEGLLGNTSKTIGTATAAAISVMVAGLVRYHGAGGGRNVNVLLEARSWPFTVHVLTVGEASGRVGGAGVRSTSRGAS